jgi:2-keto-4-pentenoate hydratase/2-oxohepta-3-ene-1,7-dioic acid hydratase in catechol pathway
MGPCITTADEVGDPQALSIKSWVNGELRQISDTSQMIWSCAQLIHFFSVNMTLKPGMVIITGTPSGTAWSTDSELGGKWAGTDGMIPAKGYLKSGDIISCEIGKIGRLDNPVV